MEHLDLARTDAYENTDMAMHRLPSLRWCLLRRCTLVGHDWGSESLPACSPAHE